ncbi:hypothetical protein SSPIM334S_02365 [Streptomyces spiroverticillatus]
MHRLWARVTRFAGPLFVLMISASIGLLLTALLQPDWIYPLPPYPPR